VKTLNFCGCISFQTLLFIEAAILKCPKFELGRDYLFACGENVQETYLETVTFVQIHLLPLLV